MRVSHQFKMEMPNFNAPDLVLPNKAPECDLRYKHNFLNLFSIFTLFISFIVAVVFSALAANGNSIIFNSSIKELSDKYNLDTSPAHWTFAIWGIIYFVIAANLGLIMYLSLIHI